MVIMHAQSPEIQVSMAKHALTKTGLAFTFALNPYRGCEHGCVYCYAPYVLKEQRQWGRFVEVKKNISELLLGELRKIRSCDVVGIGTVTDAYQPSEKKFGVTRKCIELLANAGKKFVIQTKSALVLRDIEILAKARCEVGFTITTLDSALAASLEPHASLPDERLHALKVLSDAGIKTFVFIGPVFPPLFEARDVRNAFFNAIADVKPAYVVFDKFRERTGMLEHMRLCMGEHFSRIEKSFGYTPELWTKEIAALASDAIRHGLIVQASETEKWDEGRQKDLYLS
jgi:DNA repair photolyase